VRSLAFLLRARELAPQDMEVRISIARDFAAIHQSADAIKEALAILEQNSGSSDAIIILAESSRSEKEIAAAEERLEKFPQKDNVAFHLAAASIAAWKHDLDRAQLEAQSAVMIDPKSSRAHLMLASAFFRRNDNVRAGQEFKVAAGLAPARSDERTKCAEFEALTGAPDKAAELLQEITKEAPDRLKAWQDLAQIAFSQKKYDQALSDLENILSRDADNPDGKLLQAQILLATNKQKEAIPILTTLNTNYPNSAMVKYQLARAYLAEQNMAPVMQLLGEAVAAQPDFADAVVLRAEINFEAREFQAVIASLPGLLKEQPELSVARLLLARAYENVGRLEEAARLFRDQTALAPQSADGYLLLGAVLRQQGKTDEARQALERALQLAPDNLNATDQLVEIDLAANHFDEARQQIELQLSKKPNGSGFAHFIKAKVCVAERDSIGAEAELQTALRLDPDLGRAYDLLVTIYLRQNKLSEAIDLLETKLRRKPEDADALLILAATSERTKDYQKACDAYEKILKLNPNSIPALNNLACLYAEQLNRLDRATELAQRARNLEPTNPVVADTLGWILYKRGDYGQALALMEESSRKVPDNAEIQFHLGMANYMMGHINAARFALDLAVQSTDFPDRDEAQRRLKLLQDSADAAAGLSSGELEALLAKQPNDLIILNRLAEAYERAGQPAKAAATYERILKLNVKLPNVMLKLAEFYAGPLQNREKAIDLLKRAREAAPLDRQTSATGGRIAFQAANYKWAYSLLEEGVRGGDTDPATLSDLALAAYALGRVSEARKIMEHLSEGSPAAVESQNAKSFLLMTSFEEPSPEAVAAEPEVLKIWKDHPNDVAALMAKAAIELQRKDRTAAASIYSQVLRQYPDFAPAQKRLAMLYLDSSDDLSVAYDLAMKARKALPDDPDVARTLAKIAYKRREFSYAIQLFQESAQKQPLSALDLYYLGMAQLENKQENQGKQNLERALAAAPDQKIAEEIKRQIGQSQAK